MGNLQITVNTEEEAVILYEKSTKQCLAVNISLQIWNSNSIILQNLLKEKLNLELPVRQNI